MAGVPPGVSAGYGEDDPVTAAVQWIEAAINEHDWARAWKLTDPVYRRIGAQYWIHGHRDHPAITAFDREELADALAEAEPSHSLWSSFVLAQIQSVSEVWPNGLDISKWDASHHDRVGTPDHALIRFTQVQRLDVPESNEVTPARAWPFIVHRTEHGWLMAAINSEKLPAPGWPPQF